MSLGEYYADLDESTQLWCVFNTKDREPYAYSIHMSEEQAVQEAEIKNRT